MKRTLTTLVLSGLAGMAQADITVQTVLYEIDGQPYEGLLVFDEAVTTPRPVSASNVAAPMNRVADSVITTVTPAPSWMRRLTSMAVL